jgi:hypothetical protein
MLNFRPWQATEISTRPDRSAKTKAWMMLLTLKQLGQNWGRKTEKAEFIIDENSKN